MTGVCRYCGGPTSDRQYTLCGTCRTAPLEVRFARHVDSSGGPEACWPWTAATKHGYGEINVDGRMEATHRVAYSLQSGGPIPPGREICHTCDNPPCVNPRHLYLGDRASNMSDMVRRGRHRGTTGYASPNRKLTDLEAAEIRGRRAAGERLTEIASTFGVSIGVVSRIGLGQSYVATRAAA